MQWLVKGLEIELDMFKPVDRFSCSMKRKLEIVRSLMQHPQVLFLDERSVRLDPTNRRNLWDYLRQVRQERGTTIFLTTHYLDEAEQSDRICIINQGKIVSYGTPDDVKADLIEAYLLLDADNREQLRAELEQLSMPFTETPRFKVMLNGHSAQQVIQAIRTPLTVLQTHTPTLEDAYVAIVGHNA